jgi:hypothetical protein
VLFVVDELVNAVTFRESIEQTIFVFSHSSFKVSRDTDIKGSISFTGKNVNKIGIIHTDLIYWILAFAGTTC